MGGPSGGVAWPHPHSFPSSLDDQHSAFLKQLVGARVRVGCYSANTAIPMTPTF